jgi:ABC-type lipoprotein release transport system permease subunit
MRSWRARWRELAVLALMIGVAGAMALAAIAGARRSASALDRFHDAAQVLDVFVAGDVTTPEPAALLDLLDGPLVESTNDLVFLLVDIDRSGVVFAPTSRRGLNVEQGVLVAGRRADPDSPDEVVLSDGTAARLGLSVGDTLDVGSITPEQADAMFTRGEEPTSLDGPRLRLRVVGIARTGFDLMQDNSGTGLTLTTPAFWDRYGDEIGIGSRSHMVRLADQPDALERFTDAVEEAYGNEHLPSINVGQGEDSVVGSIAVITVALVLLALVIAVAGAVWIAVATSREQRPAGNDLEIMRAMGVTTGERRGLLVGCVLPALAGGLAIAPLLAVALSPLLPVGQARRIDPDPGLHADLTVLVAGSGVLALILVVIVTISAAKIVRRGGGFEPGDLRVPPLVNWAAGWLPPAPGNGVRFALHSPPRAAAPVRSALAGAAVGVVALVAVVVVGASMQRLVETPARWGTTWDTAVADDYYAVGEPDSPDARPEIDREELLADPDIEAASVLLYDEQVTIDGVEAIAMTLDPVKGEITPTVVEGREPRADDEIALAHDTFEDVGVPLGTTVTVGSRSHRSEDFRVVGVIAFPTIGEPSAVATGASLTARGGDRLQLGDPSGGDDVGTPYVVVRWAPGVGPDDALARRGIETSTSTLEVTATGPTVPPEVTGLQDVRQFPFLAGAGLVVLGVIATSHALIVTVRRRRMDLAVLSALGLAPAQRRAVIHAQVTTISLVALVVGVPLGVVAGRVVWSSIAQSMGLVTDASFPLMLLAVGAIGLVVALNALAAFPARSARRLGVADALRSE